MADLPTIKARVRAQALPFRRASFDSVAPMRTPPSEPHHFQRPPTCVMASVDAVPGLNKHHHHHQIDARTEVGGYRTGRLQYAASAAIAARCADRERRQVADAAFRAMQQYTFVADGANTPTRVFHQ